MLSVKNNDCKNKTITQNAVRKKICNLINLRDEIFLPPLETKILLLKEEIHKNHEIYALLNKIVDDTQRVFSFKQNRRGNRYKVISLHDILDTMKIKQQNKIYYLEENKKNKESKSEKELKEDSEEESEKESGKASEEESEEENPCFEKTIIDTMIEDIKDFAENVQSLQGIHYLKKKID